MGYVIPQSGLAASRRPGEWSRMKAGGAERFKLSQVEARQTFPTV